MSAVLIESGPFKGLHVAPQELKAATFSDGSPKLNADGKAEQYWPTHARTRHFLEKFPPDKGWAVEVAASRGDFELPDGQTPGLDAHGASVPLQQPTVRFDARLVAPNGRVIGTATVLAIINGPGAWEGGETRARGRLYEAMGLPSDPTGGGDAEGAASPAQTATPPPTTTVTPAPGSKLPSKLPGVAQAIIAQEAVVASVPPKEEEKDTAPHERPGATLEMGAATPPPAQPVTSISKNLLMQIETRARQAGIEVPQFADVSAARKFYKDLLAGLKQPAAGEAR